MRPRIGITPVMKITFSITLIIMSALSITDLIGLYPDKAELQLEERTRIAEGLTIQIAIIASNRNVELIRRTISAVQSRDKNIRSIALKDSNSKVLAATSDHKSLWADAEPDKSTQTHVRVPITDRQKHWGTLEIVFHPIERGSRLAGMSEEFLMFSAFTGVLSFLFIYLILHITLRQLDPARAIPSRVQSAFDSLSDGIAVIDENDNVLLLNQSLIAILGEQESDYLGSKLSSLLWRFWKEEDQSTTLPWLVTLKENRTVRDVAMNLRRSSGAIVNVLVNASTISTDGRSVSGALVSFKDVTVMERKSRDLALAYSQLKESETEIKKQNSQLQYLANHDPLTSCLNRRSLFEKFQAKFDANSASGRALMCMMIDIDHFKSVNDTYGHAVGDSVIAGLAKLLRETAREDDLVGRYGGEEFCMVLDGLNRKEAGDVAEYLRKQVKARSSEWLGQDRSLSISLGLAPADPDVGSINNAVNNADQALYTAKETGRDRAIQWHPETFSKVERDQLETELGSKNAEPGLTASPLTPTTTTSIDQFAERLERSIRLAKQNDKLVTVVFVSLDSFDKLAKVHGEQVASSFLLAVDERLKSFLQVSSADRSITTQERNPEIVKADQNCYLFELTDLDDVMSVARMMQRLSDKLAIPMQIDNQSQSLEFSIGASLYPNDGQDARELIENAALAQSQSKEVGGANGFRMFSKNIVDLAQEQLHLEKVIRRSIERNEFCLYFQPIVDLTNGVVACAEVLLRSSNQDLKGISIESIIQVAEMSGLIDDLSNYVYETVFSTMNEWKRKGIRLPLVSVNLSAEHLKNKDVVSDLISCVNKYQIDPCSIQLELTETTIVTDLKRTAEILRTLQNYGFHIALDDFGTGQSSLSQLLEVRPDTIKIDKTFVQSLTNSPINQILVDLIIELARKIGAKLVCEGVETQEQLELLLENECRYVQGYLFSRPLPESAFIEWLQLFGPQSQTTGYAHKL